MKVAQIVAFVVFALVISPSAADYQCHADATKSLEVKDWITMVSPCKDLMLHQIGIEIQAAIAYLGLAAHFSRDVVNRPGFSKFFFESASEEREHAIKIINYLLMRGELTKDLHNLIENPYTKLTAVKSGFEALKTALNLEISVTKKINTMIKKCEQSVNESNPKKIVNDYHLVDYLTGEFLEEQYQGQRDLAGKMVTLEKMNDNYGSLGEFLFDKTLLNQEIPIL